MTSQYLNLTDFSIKADDYYYKNFAFEAGDDSSLFIVAGINNKKTRANSLLLEFINTSADKIKTDIDAGLSFESALKNYEASLGHKEQNYFLLGSIQMLVILFSKNNFLASKYGKLYACTLKNGRLMNVNDDNYSEHKTESIIFKTIISGQFSHNDKFIFLNNSAANLCDLELLEQTLPRSPKEASAKIKKMLEKNRGKKLESINFTLISFVQRNDAPKQQNLTTAPPKQEIIIPQIKMHVRQAGEKLKNVANTAPIKKTFESKRQKRIAIGILIIVLIISIFYIYQNISANKQIKETIGKIELNSKEAMELLANKNAFPAVSKLLESKSLAASIMLASPDYPANIKEIYENSSNLLNEVAKITEIENPEKIADLTNFGIKFSPKHIIATDDHVDIFGSEFGLVYKIHGDTNKKGFNFFSTEEDNINTFAKSSDSLAFFSEKNKAYIYTPKNNNLTISGFSFPKSDLSTLGGVNIIFYDKNSGHITKYSRSSLKISDAFQTSKDIVSLADDGKDLFALTTDKKIIKVSSANKILIALNESPLLKYPDAIFADLYSDNLYAVNNDGVIAIFKKNGGFVKQFDAHIDGPIMDASTLRNETMFILTEDAVYKIPLN